MHFNNFFFCLLSKIITIKAHKMSIYVFSVCEELRVSRRNTRILTHAGVSTTEVCPSDVQRTANALPVVALNTAALPVCT
jgi:hypothetical protein